MRVVSVTDADGRIVAQSVIMPGKTADGTVEGLCDVLGYPAPAVPADPKWCGVVVWGDGDVIVREGRA